MASVTMKTFRAIRIEVRDKTAHMINRLPNVPPTMKHV